MSIGETARMNRVRPHRRATALAWAAGGALLLAIVACNGRQSLTRNAAAAELQAHMTFLADDRLEGRGTGTPGFELAAQYVAAQFAAAGVKPSGNGNFFQPVRFRRSRPTAAESSFVIGGGGRSHALQWGTDFVARSGATVRMRAPIIFVGYGITDPETGHDDYATDVRGSIVAFLPGAPPGLPASRRDYYTSVKWRLAQQHGAVATVELSTPEEDRSWSWQERTAWVGEWAGAWLESDGQPPADTPLPRILFSSAGTARLLALTSQTLSEVVAAPRAFRIDTAAVTIASRHDDVTAPNVIGVIQGSDPQLRDEYVVYIAHLDGLGRADPVDGDDIYNGAIDNALGSAMLLTIAKRFSRLAPPPKRSILFIATTGEEFGIAGSPYFVEHPTVPLASIVAVINIDGPSHLAEPVAGVLAMGAANSTLGLATGAAAARLGIRVNQSDAPLNFSDHYPFVMKGIPALWIVQNGAGEPSEAVKASQLRVHTPRDDMQRSFRWETAATLTELNVLIGQMVAMQAERPRWIAGDILGKAFVR
jgi:hypothetical protein